MLVARTIGRRIPTAVKLPLMVIGSLFALVVFIVLWSLIAGEGDYANVRALVTDVAPGEVCLRVDRADEQEFYGGCFDAENVDDVEVGDCVEARVPMKATGADRVAREVRVDEASACDFFR